MRHDRMRCPSCGSDLEPTRTIRGTVWLCGACRSGAATIPILRQVAPREFVNHVWQAALRNGRRSQLRCPSCGQAFTGFSGSQAVVEPELEVCTRCFWVWLSAQSLKHLGQLKEPPSAVQNIAKVAHAKATREELKAPSEARVYLGWLAAQVLLSLLP
jgi:Zn-finger nucleic acid-binding protein